MKQVVNFGYDMEVTSKTDKETNATFTYKDMTMNIESPMMNMSYDSKNPPTNAVGMNAMLEKVVNSILGNKLQIVVASDGSVKSVTGMEAITTKMAAAFAGDAQGMQMVEMMKGQFNDEALRQQLEQSFKVYPPAGTKVGETYDVTQNVSSGGIDMKIDSKYTLKSADGKVAVVDYVSVISGMGGQLKGDMKGTIKFDMATGLNETDALQTMKGTVSGNGMDIPMDLTTNMKVRMSVAK